MASSDKVPMLEEGHRKLDDELKRLKRERPEIVEAIEAARAHGDLSENAEYHAAKERQGQIEAMIADLEDRLSRAMVIDVGDHRLDLALALLRGMIFRIFRKIAVRTRILDRLDDFGTFYCLELAHLLTELAMARFQHWDLLGTRHCSRPFFFKTAPAASFAGFAKQGRIMW